MLQCLIQALDVSSSTESKLEQLYPEKEASETEPQLWSRCCGINGPGPNESILDTNKFIKAEAKARPQCELE